LRDAFKVSGEPKDVCRPRACKGTEEERLAKFREMRDLIREKLESFVADQAKSK